MKLFLFFILSLVLFYDANLQAQTNLYVAADGTAPFKSVQEAVRSAPPGTQANPVIIHIKAGIYHELIDVPKDKGFLKFIGEGASNTVLTYGWYAGMTNGEGKQIGTFNSRSTMIEADDFTAENLTFENSAGAVGQALAIRVDGDRAAFRHCRFLGWQDTILLNHGRQYFEDCYVAGAVDFIFGAGTAWFEKCEIHCLGKGYITAASTPQEQPYGFVFSNCKITGAKPDVRTFLGRPWRDYAGTIFLNTDMTDVVRPAGWDDWKKPQTHTTSRYAEYNSTGAGANPSARETWVKQLTKAEAEQITLSKVLGGWEPAGP